MGAQPGFVTFLSGDRAGNLVGCRPGFFEIVGPELTLHHGFRQVRKVRRHDSKTTPDVYIHSHARNFVPDDALDEIAEPCTGNPDRWPCRCGRFIRPTRTLSRADPRKHQASDRHPRLCCCRRSTTLTVGPERIDPPSRLQSHPTFHSCPLKLLAGSRITKSRI